eukprot:COSAG02_NODE_60852_length_270_cov_0.602339_1_plen_36_part_10
MVAAAAWDRLIDTADELSKMNSNQVRLREGDLLVML